ncbi:MAG TPA: hypothetical protein VFT62_11460 [Mycobacteriales bacterium]|nr:hypothetical protein [Mycobacteriales bacterium]
MTGSGHATLASAAALAALTLAGCGGAVTERGVRPWPSPQASQQAQIRQAWSTAFAGGSSTSARAAVLQNAEALRGALQRLDADRAWRGTRVRVDSVTLTDASHAIVTYTLIRHSQPILHRQHGEAVLVNGRWKVGTPAFCVVLALRGAGQVPCPSAPPSQT